MKKTGYSYFATPTEIELENQSTMIAQIKERKNIDFTCCHNNATCEIFFQKEERKRGKEGRKF